MGNTIKQADHTSPDVQFGVATQVLGRGTFFVSAYGDVDPVTAPELETELLETAHRGARHLVVDLTGTTFFDSSGVHALVRTGARLHASGLQFDIVCGNPSIKRVLEITGVDQALRVHATIENAISPSRAPEMAPVVVPFRRRNAGAYA